MQGRSTGNKNIIATHKLDWEIKNSIGNREAKELICTIHKHELRGRGDSGGWGGEGHRWNKREKKMRQL